MLATLTKWLAGTGEVKASAAKPLIALQTLGAPVWTPRDYAALAKAGFQRNVIAYRCIRMVSEAAASVPLRVTENGAPMTEHPLKRLLDHPNPEQAGAELFEAFYGFLQTAGNAYLEAVVLEGEVRELYGLRPDRMKARAGRSGWVDGWDYLAGGRTATFRRDAQGFLPILHCKLFHPSDDYYGLSPLEAAADAVDVHNSAGAWNKALLDNAARPSGALVYKGPAGAESLTAEQFERLKTELSELHQGARNAGRPLLLDGGLEWRAMSLTPSEMDFISAKNQAAREIALAFGVPPMLLGIPGDNTYANYKEANLAFWRQTVLPLVSKTATALSNWLGPRSGGARIGYDAAGVEALSTEREAHWARVTRAPFLTVNEKRRMFGFTEMEGGDVLDIHA